MKNILVATDFSPASRNAVKYAVSLAQSFRAKIILVNIVTPPIIVDDSILASVLVTQAEIMEANKKLMDQEIEILTKKYSVKMIGFTREGFALDKIEEMSKVKHADFIVMGMKGKGKSKSVFGSTTTAIIRKTTFPVLVIPEKAVFSPIRNITFASDFDSSVDLDRYTVLLGIAENFNSLINIINVQKAKSSLSAEKAIGKMKTSLAFSRHEHQFHTIKDSKVEEGINKFIEMNPTDILVMVAHKHSLFERMFGKVHTKAMSYQTKIPLLVLQSK
ncbi:MAG: universal stress protein [Ginsengibacter sp.]